MNEAGRSSLWRSAAGIAALAWPILIGQLATVANGVIDTAMTARSSVDDLAALSIGISIYVSIFVGLNGVLQALAPVIGQLFGARELVRIGAKLKQALWLALFLSGLGGALLLHPAPLLGIASAAPTLSAKATLYLQIIAMALPATLAFRIYSAFNNAIGKPKMVMTIQLCALVLKIPLNTLFIFGGWGIPAMGGPGCAVATTVITWSMLLCAWLVLRHASVYRAFALFGSGWVRPHWQDLRDLLRLGIPMGLSYLIEVTAYTFMALFIARLGAVAVAGHQLTANFGTILYMLPLSIASATGTLVARAIGARHPAAAKQTGQAGILLAAALVMPLGALIWFCRSRILHAYTDQTEVIAAALPLFFFVAVYQVFDAIQVIVAFTLRAYHVAVVPTILYAVALWGCGLGGGYLIGLDPYQCMPTALHGAPGFWLANSLSIAMVALALYLYLQRVQRQHAASYIV
ncbi:MULTISPECIES: MATE family efflux transporter [unclassified Undibacterium]|uniref:MATE family efflux transporter n=1 Tax=unclassified Undibacterium TaxID=2630295 RepID=UPI002AC8C66C|nr:MULTISPECIES: MATE family efflux transporter [unclassified Undibacterium]MEB0137618.1 MATE family efflux transporter [Undibacterium sp. CCC2.1]MEB0170619.1 MATE family efflux transporter [Undibacterium sp. CCC1.1]MEB0174560.1 MATE family efflux transporter [Undibacterium sp. CCC3.4]MEB0213643.1 MATE family efflux transporter [Undibacterium sp. 5I2]WPX43810.1 MATE family efflux transporter [Undibacterium sp. CCC3.4]